MKNHHQKRAQKPHIFGVSLTSAEAFYYLTATVLILAVASMAMFVRSPFGASVRGTRDQPRRMSALGYNVWLVRFLAFLLSGFWTAIAGLIYIYHKQFISPPVVGLQSSAELLLMVISGGTATLLGPIAGAAIVPANAPSPAEDRKERAA